MSMHGTREMNGFSSVVSQHPVNYNVSKKAIWTRAQAQKLVQLVQAIELTSQRTDWMMVSAQIGLSPVKCKEKYYQLTKAMFTDELASTFISLTKKALLTGAADLDWHALEEYFNKPASWLQNKYNQIVYNYFTEQDIHQLKAFVEASDEKIKWKQCQKQVGFSYSVCYQMFTRLYKEQIAVFTTEVENKLKQIDKDDTEQMKQLSVETGIELCFLKFWKINKGQQ